VTSRAADVTPIRDAVELAQTKMLGRSRGSRVAKVTRKKKFAAKKKKAEALSAFAHRSYPLPDY